MTGVPWLVLLAVFGTLSALYGNWTESACELARAKATGALSFERALVGHEASRWVLTPRVDRTKLFQDVQVLKATAGD